MVYLIQRSRKYISISPMFYWPKFLKKQSRKKKKTSFFKIKKGNNFVDKNRKNSSINNIQTQIVSFSPYPFAQTIHSYFDTIFFIYLSKHQQISKKTTTHFPIKKKYQKHPSYRFSIHSQTCSIFQTRKKQLKSYDIYTLLYQWLLIKDKGERKRKKNTQIFFSFSQFFFGHKIETIK